jgi:hypothetical protein
MKLVFGLLVLVLASMVTCRLPSDVEARLDRKVARVERMFMERTAHMSKARLRRFGICTAAITVLGPVLKPLFVPLCQKGVSALLGWINGTLCPKLPSSVKGKCSSIVSWLQGKWAQYGASGCGLLWDALMTFLKTLC